MSKKQEQQPTKKDVLIWLKENKSWWKEKDLICKENEIKIKYLQDMIKNYQQQIISIKEQNRTNQISKNLVTKAEVKFRKQYNIK